MNPQNKISQSQKLMVFVLSMSLYGLATLFTELIPSFFIYRADHVFSGRYRGILSRVFPVYSADTGYAL